MAHPELPLSRASARLAQPGSDVWAVHYDALARQEQGDDIILLSVGDPDFNTPPEISDYVIQQINKGRTHYSPAAGETGLRQAIALLEAENTGLQISPDQVVVFPGATACLYATAACILNPADEIIIPEPMYVGYTGIFTTIGAKVVNVPLLGADFQLDIDGIMAAVTPATKAVMVNTPGNPCGNIIPSEDLRRLAELCLEAGLWLICDEVYSLITFEDKHVSLLNSTDNYDNVVVIDGLSKSHAMSGWRVGWAVTNPVMAQALINLSGAAFFGTSQFVQDAAAYALANDAKDVEIMRQAYQKRRDYVASRVAQIPDLELSVPKGGMFVMLGTKDVSPSGDHFSRQLLDQHGVSVLPGICFGPSGKHYVRLSLTEDIPILEKAMNKVAALCAHAD